MDSSGGQATLLSNGRGLVLLGAALILGVAGCSAPRGDGPGAPTASVPPSPTALGTQSPAGWIAYDSADSLALVRSDGRSQHPVFSDGFNARQPDWSPDGRSLVFVHEAADRTSDIWITDNKGANRRRIIECLRVCTAAEHPAWSPDGTQIAYTTRGEGTGQDVRIAQADSGRVVRTVPAPALESLSTPRWSPDGQQLAVAIGHYTPDGSDFRVDGSAIGIIDVSASPATIRTVTPFTLMAGGPAWSPSGDQLAFQAGNLNPLESVDPPSNLFTMRPDGSGLVQITDQQPGQAALAVPDWTAGSRPLTATLTQGPNNNTLTTLEANGADMMQLLNPATGTPIAGGNPRTSPPSRS